MSLSNMEFSLLENIIFIVFLLFVGIYLIRKIYIKVSGNGKLHEKSVVTERARLLSKYTDKELTQTAYRSNHEGNLGVVEHHTVYMAVFALVDKDNRQIELEVSPDVYHALEEGTTEALTYRTGLLIRFGNIINVPQSKGADFVPINRSSS